MSITNFYTDQEIFITGGSGIFYKTLVSYPIMPNFWIFQQKGFIGKALIEKLLRSFSNVGKIYILIRSKKGKNANERLQEILKTSLFNRVREEQPESFSKLCAISGDCQELGLSISQEDLVKLKNVTMIFHSAASVRFDDHLRSAILLNTRGTHELVKIAGNLKRLKAFIHVSTTYSNPDKHIVEEKVSNDIHTKHMIWNFSICLKLFNISDISSICRLAYYN